MSGVSYLEFLKGLIKRVDSDWSGVQAVLERIRDTLFTRRRMVVNLTADASLSGPAEAALLGFAKGLDEGDARVVDWAVDLKREAEGLIIPAQVNYVGKGANLKALGYTGSGAASVALRYLNTTYLWDKVRVQGGAYGGSSRFDLSSGNFAFLSYRDPNLLKTLDVYDGAAKALRAQIGETDLVRSVIGVVGDMDRPEFPDSKGYSAMWRILTGTTDALRQQRRDEVLGTSRADFLALADALEAVSREGLVVVLGGEAAITAANEARPGLLKVSKVL